jgi:hypothetical protein
MIKNTAGQKIGGQMVSATDGSAFTSAVTVYVTGDAGAQAQGSVGSGACTHEGNGYHTYAPAQAETNYDLVAFTFVGTGAIPQTVQVYTIAGDAFTRLGAPAGASVSADIAAIQSDTNDIQTRLPAALVSGRIDASVGAMAADTLTSSALAASAVTEIQSGLATSAALATTDGKVDAILVDTSEIGVAGAGLTNINLPNQTMDIVGNITGNLSGSVGSVTGLTASDVGAIKTKTDSLTFTVAGHADVNLQYVNDVEVTGDGQPGTEWGP